MASTRIFRLVYIFVAALVIAAVALIFFSPAIDGVSMSVDGVHAEDVILRAKAVEAVEGCLESDRGCAVYSLYDLTLQECGSDAVACAALFARYLDSISVANVYAQGESAVLACGLSSEEFYTYYSAGRNQPPFYTDSARIAGGQVWVAIPDFDLSVGSVRIDVIASSPVEVRVFESGRNIDFNSDYYQPGCGVAASTEISTDCAMVPGNALAVYAAEGIASISVSLSPSGLQVQDISTSFYRNQKCITIDFEGN